MYVSYPRLFTEARRRGAWKGTSLKSVTIGSKQSHGHLLIQRRIPNEHPSHSVGYPGSGSVFEHVSGSTRLEGVRETRIFVDGGQDEHERVRKVPLYGVGSCDPILWETSSAHSRGSALTSKPSPLLPLI
jgi:hypothetical protein